MSIVRVVVAMLGLSLSVSAANAVEGNSLAGPVGGTDIRSAFLPPPGLYGGVIYAHGEADGFTDGNGDEIPALNGLDITSNAGAAFLLYVPNVQVLGGSLGFAGVAPIAETCGRLFEFTPDKCISGAFDPYVEASWSRFFGTPRASSQAGAFPIFEGLAVQLGVGAIVPIGSYEPRAARTNGVTLGNNIWDVAPFVALTYTTPPLLADGTEFSAKVYWNSYAENDHTKYQTGDLINVDFAITEHIGRLQIGLAGVYFVQIEDDRFFGFSVPPDGRRAELLSLGGVAAYDIPEMGATVKLKAQTTIFTENFSPSQGFVLTYAQKLY